MKHAKRAVNGLDQASDVLKAFADPVRLRLLNLLGGAREEVCVCHLHGALDLPQPTVSRHLAYLRRSGLVLGRKQGLWVYYRLAKASHPLHRILIGCLGSSLGDPEIFHHDLERLDLLASCS